MKIYFLKIFENPNVHPPTPLSQWTTQNELKMLLRTLCKTFSLFVAKHNIDM